MIPSLRYSPNMHLYRACKVEAGKITIIGGGKGGLDNLRIKLHKKLSAASEVFKREISVKVGGKWFLSVHSSALTFQEVAY